MDEYPPVTGRAPHVDSLPLETPLPLPQNKEHRLDKLLDINAAADILGISPWTVRAVIRDGNLKPVRIGRRVLIEASELDRFIRERRQESPDR